MPSPMKSNLLTHCENIYQLITTYYPNPTAATREQLVNQTAENRELLAAIQPDYNILRNRSKLYPIIQANSFNPLPELFDFLTTCSDEHVHFDENCIRTYNARTVANIQRMHQTQKNLLNRVEKLKKGSQQVSLIEYATFEEELELVAAEWQALRKQTLYTTQMNYGTSLLTLYATYLEKEKVPATLSKALASVT